MIWESVTAMTLIDLVILGITGVTISALWRTRSGLVDAGAARGTRALVFGLALIAGFFLLDLLIMHVGPWIWSPGEAMARMETLHVEWSWVVLPIAIVSVAIGVLGIVRGEVSLADRLRHARTELDEAERQRTEAERALQLAERRFEDALDAAEMGWWVYDLTADEITWSETTARIYGVPLEEFDGRVETYRSYLHPEDMARVQEAVAAAADGDDHYTVEHRRLLPRGEMRWIAGRGRICRDEEGQATTLRGVAWDITDRKRAEEAAAEAERLQAELARRLSRQQRLESLGTLSGGIAHDFNNLLTPILGHVEMLQQDLEREEDRERLEQIMIAAERARALVRQILSFSGKVETAPVAVDVRDLVEEGLDLARSVLPSTVEIRRTFDEGLGTVAMDATQLTQIILNLCSNSADAMPDGGVLDVQVTPVEVDEAGELAFPELVVGRYVRVTVADNGTGMSDAVVERAFEPFFTTKDVGKGTGLGLSQVLGIVQGYGGTVLLFSEQGVGTTVHVFLPSTDAEPPALEADESAPPELSGRILVVDDERTVGETLGMLLRTLGFVVTVEASADRALERLERSEEFDLVMTDQTMPGMTGTELVRAVRAMRPHFPAVLMSGLADLDDALDDGVGFLMKPFTRVELAKVVADALDDVERS